MGSRFRKSFKVAPGVRVNLGKKSAGVSIGGKHGGVSINSKSGARVRVSAPGTGWSHSTRISGKSKKRRAASDPSPAPAVRKSSEMDRKEKEKIARLRWPSLVFSVVLLACISVLIFLDASVGVVFAGSGISVAVIVFTMWAFKLAGDLREEKSAQQAPPKSAKEKQVDEAINTRWFFAVLGVGLMVIAVLGSVAHMPVFLSVYTFLCSLFSLAYALYGFFKYWDRKEQEEEE